MFAMYQFTSMYMKGIQTGIQGGHATNEMMVKYIDGELTKAQMEMFNQWVITDKVVKIKNMGNTSKTMDFINLLLKQDKYPYASFREPELNDAITAVSLILPCYISGKVLMNESCASVRLLMTTVQEMRSPS